jgi:hypothetical protein
MLSLNLSNNHIRSYNPQALVKSILIKLYDKPFLLLFFFLKKNLIVNYYLLILVVMSIYIYIYVYIYT